MPKKCPSIGLNQDSEQSEERCSELSQDERKAEGVSSTPKREALVDCIDVASIDEALDPRCFNSSPVHMKELGRTMLWNHDRMSSWK